MRRRLLTPRWIIAHLVVVVLAVVFIRLGFWQLDRLAERRTENERVLERRDASTISFHDLIGQVAAGELEYRSVSLEGIFDITEEVLIRSRTSNGEAGFHVITPLITSDGEGVLINRGWVPLALDTPQAPETSPPPVRVEVVGTIRASESAPALGPEDPTAGILERMYWIDIPRIQQQSAHELSPVYVELSEQRPSQPGRIPVPIVPGELSEGSHLAYALQWFSFAVIGGVGYAALLRRFGTGGAGSTVQRDGQPVDDPRPGD